MARADPPVIANVDPPVMACADPPAIPNEEPPVMACADPPVIANEEPPVMARADPPVIANVDPPVMARADPPVIANVDPPVMACADPPVIASTLLSLFSATAIIGSAIAISDAPSMHCILALLAVCIFALLIKSNYSNPSFFFFWPASNSGLFNIRVSS